MATRSETISVRAGRTTRASWCSRAAALAAHARLHHLGPVAHEHLVTRVLAW